MPATLSGSWKSNGDFVIPSVATALIACKATLWSLKAMIKGDAVGPSNGHTGAIAAGSRWTHHQSCDGASVSSVTDLWGTSFDETKIIRGTGGAARSWIVLRSPNALLDGPWYLVIAFNGTADDRATFTLSRTAPTGGTTTAHPTSSVETANADRPFTHNDTSTRRFSISMEANGSFWFVSAVTGGYRMGFAVSEIVNARSVDVARCCLITAYRSAGGPFMVNAATQNESNMGAWLSFGNNPSGSYAISCRNGLNTLSALAMVPNYGGIGANNNIFLEWTLVIYGGTGNANPTDSADDFLPAVLYIPLTSHRQVKGAIKDAYVGPYRGDAVMTPNVNPLFSASGDFRFPMLFAPSIA